MKNNSLRCLVMLLLGGGILWISVFLGGCHTSEPIKIGFIAGMSGRVADLGVSGRDGAQMLIEQVNRAGGIHGRSLQLIYKDDQQDPQRVKQMVRELIEEQVMGIIGPMTSDMAIAVTPLLNKAKLVAVAPTVSTPDLSGLDDYFFRVTSTSKLYAAMSAAYHLKHQTMKEIAVVYDLDNKAYCEHWLETFQTVFTKGGGKILQTIGFQVEQERGFLDISRELLQAKPDGILIIANSMDAALFCQQIRKLNSEIAITLADWGATERLLELGGKAIEGVSVIQTFFRANTAPEYQRFRAEYEKRYQREPGFPGVAAYEAAGILVEALRHQENGQSLKEALLALRDFSGLYGKFSFDRFGDVKRLDASISVIRNGQFVVLAQ